MKKATVSLLDSDCKIRIGERLDYELIANTGFSGIVCKDCCRFFHNFESWFYHFSEKEKDKVLHNLRRKNNED